MSDQIEVVGDLQFGGSTDLSKPPDIQELIWEKQALQAENQRLQAELQALRDQIEYARGGEKAQAAQAHFEALREGKE